MTPFIRRDRSYSQIRAFGCALWLTVTSHVAPSQSIEDGSLWSTSISRATESFGVGVAATVAQPTAQTPRSSSNPGVDPEAVLEVAEQRNRTRRTFLFGDWMGTRTKLEDKGIVFDFYYIADALGDPYGARFDFGVWGRIRAIMDVDFSKLTSNSGLTFHATGLWQYGIDLSKEYILSSVDSSSLPSAHTLRLDTYFLKQYLLHNRLAIRAGKIAAYDSYGDSEFGASFINLALGYAHSNLNSAAYLSFNPAGVPAFEIKVMPINHFYVTGMVASEERNPYSQDPNGLGFHLGGPVFTGETGYIHDSPKPSGETMAKQSFITNRETGHYPGTYRFGGGYDPHNFTDLLTGATVPGNYVLYAQADQAVYRVSSKGRDKNRGLDLTYSQDYAPANRTQYSGQLWAGGRWTGPAGGRWSRDTIGLGYVRTVVGSHYREMILATKGKDLTAEQLIEANYLANLTPWLSVQPVLQWFVRPQGDATRDSVFVIGFRTKVLF